MIRASGYNIHFSANLQFKQVLQPLARSSSAIFILCDSNTMSHCLPAFITANPFLADARIIETEPGEASKCLEVAANIWQTLLDDAADRNALVINLGGGMITDLGGFCASVYKRGVRFVHVPTSLLAMADASVGAKTGINFGGIKNPLGSFSNPQAVFISTAFLATLPERQLRNGLAEIYKMAIIADAPLWRKLKKNESDFDSLITSAVNRKNAIVKKDPLENDLRKILNFGHTVGHAIESAFMEEVLHGEAVVMGMIIETIVARNKRLIKKSHAAEIVETLKQRFSSALIHVQETELIHYLANDKKSKNGVSFLALPDGEGSCKPAVKVTQPEISRAITEYNQLKW